MHSAISIWMIPAMNDIYVLRKMHDCGVMQCWLLYDRLGEIGGMK